MDTPKTDLQTFAPAPPPPLTREAYHGMAAAGALSEDDRVELLEGQLIDMSPIGPRHAIITDNLIDLLRAAFDGRARVRCQQPVILNDTSEPQPDIALVQRPWRGYPHTHPAPEDIFLLIEVADTSLTFDCTIKLPLYARTGIREVWIIDLTRDIALIHRDPKAGTYSSVLQITQNATMDVQALPGPTIALADVFA